MAYAHESEMFGTGSEWVRDISLILYSENRSAMAVTRNGAQAGESGFRPKEFHGSSLAKSECGRLARGNFLVGQVKSSLTGLDALTGSYLTKPNMTWDSYAGNC